MGCSVVRPWGSGVPLTSPHMHAGIIPRLTTRIQNLETLKNWNMSHKNNGFPPHFEKSEDLAKKDPTFPPINHLPQQDLLYMEMHGQFTPVPIAPQGDPRQHPPCTVTSVFPSYIRYLCYWNLSLQLLMEFKDFHLYANDLRRTQWIAQGHMPDCTVKSSIWVSWDLVMI